jgi:predicted ATPase/DNA-binding CsgD family transcriptional regulator
MTAPGVGENSTSLQSPKSPRRLRTVEPAKREPAPGPSERTFHNLPLELSSFVGREKELAEVKGLLKEIRLLTLTGSGGCGKTRLALAAASEIVGGYEDGVWFVELAPLADPSLVAQAIASTLGVREQPGRSPTETLSNYLRSRKVLLVLDNCEHLIEACAELAETLLRSSPELRVLATSREALGIVGEVAWPVPSLSLPDLRRLPDIETLPQYEATRLFVERAGAVKPTFALTEQNAVAVAQVCYRLDGIPLALELAAAKTKVLSVEEIFQRLDDCFRLLAAGSRTAMPRHRTLHATMDWSHELLSRKERTLFRRLAVFTGSFTLEVAESVCAGAGIDRDEVLELLSQLVDKSLVTTRERDGKTRHQLLETVRQYGQEKLSESGEEGHLRERHAGYYLALAAKAEPELKGAGQVEWLKRFEWEHDNLRAAILWLLERRHLQDAARLGWALWLFWWIRGHFAEGRRLMEEALSVNGSAAMPTSARAQGLFVAGTMACGQGDHSSAEPLLEESVTLFREVGDTRGVAYALGSAAVSAITQEQYGRGIDYSEEAADLFLEVGDKWGAAPMLGCSAVGWLNRGHHGRAKSLAEQGLRLCRETGDKHGTSIALCTLAGVAQAERNYERARALFEEGLAVSVKLGNEADVVHCLEGLASVAAAEGSTVRGARLWGAAEALLEKIEAVYTFVPDRALYRRQVAARSLIDEAAWETAWGEGRTMATEQAIEYALEHSASPETAALETNPAGLSAREAEVLRLVATGLTNAEVAEKLFLSSRTVDWHLGSIYRKLGIHSRAEATRFASEHGLL